MHELGIATEIIHLVEKEIETRGLRQLSKIKLKVGALSGIDPEALKFGYSIVSADSKLAGVELAIEWVAVKGLCRNCGRNFEVPDFAFICPVCDSPDIKITEGEELDIISLTEK